MPLNLEKIKNFLGNFQDYPEVKLVHEADQYVSSGSMKIDDKRAVTVVEGVEYDDEAENPTWVNTKLRFGYLSRIVRQRVNYAFGRNCTFSADSEEMSVLFDMDTVRKCGWFIATHGKAYMEVRFNDDGKMSGISAHDPAHCFEFTDADNQQHGFVVIEDVKNEFGLEDEDSEQKLSVRVIEESEDKSSYTITQYMYANNELTQISYIPVLTIRRLQDGKLRKYNGDIVMELFADPFKVGIYKEIKSLIDEYDEVSSVTSDYLKKSPRSPLVVKGYGTTLNELVTNLFHYNVIPVQADGEVSSLKSEQDINAAQKHLTLVEDSLREQTGWVKSELGNVGYSGAALRMRYAELDIQAQHLQAILTYAFNSIKLYIKDSLGSNIPEDVEVSFDSDVMVNETDTVTNCVNSTDLLSRRTILENHPFVRSVDIEIERLEAEGRSIYKIGDEDEEEEIGEIETDSEVSSGESGESGESEPQLDPSQEQNLTNRQREMLAENLT